MLRCETGAFGAVRPTLCRNLENGFRNGPPYLLVTSTYSTVAVANDLMDLLNQRQSEGLLFRARPPVVFMSQREDVNLLDVGVIVAGRGVCGGERGPRCVSRVTPSPASVAMQPAPEQATPSGARRPKRSPSPVDEVSKNTKNDNLIAPAADQRIADSMPAPDVLVGIVILEASSNSQR